MPSRPAPSLALSLAALVSALISAPLAARAQSLDLPGTQPGTLHAPLEPSAQCSECHGGGMAPDGHLYMASDTWPTSMMANAVRDPLFRAAAAQAEQDHAGLGTYCLRCHTPAGFVAGHATPGDGSALDPFNDMDGVHCDVCHRSLDAHATDPMAPYAGDARLFFEDALDSASPVRHGPYTDPALSPRHPSVGDPFVRDARLCGQCHDVDNPLVHRRGTDGTDTGALFPLQSTYSEWQQSDFAQHEPTQTCQDCHMHREQDALQVANIPGAPARMDVRQHDFLGGNEWGMAMLRAAYPGKNDDGFESARTRQQAFLQTAARVELVDPPAQVQAGGTVSLAVRVTNLTGHKLPSGDDARVMWLQVEAGGQVVSGAFADDELVEDAQLRAYRIVAGHLENGTAVPDDFVAQHEVILEDTRIPPQGMTPDSRTMPVGRDYSGGAGGALRNDDTAHFTLTAPATAGPLAVTVRLLYRTTTKHYVETVAGAIHTGDTGHALLAAWDGAGHAPPFAIATAMATVQVMGGPVTGNDGGSDGGAGGDGGVGTDGGTGGPTPGCGCRTQGSRRDGGFAVLALAAALAAARRRRRG